MKSPRPRSRGVKRALLLAVAALGAIAIIAPASASAKPPNTVFVADLSGVLAAYPLNGAAPTPIPLPEGCDQPIATEWSNGRLYFSAVCGAGGTTKIFSVVPFKGSPRLEVDDPEFAPGVDFFRGLAINEKKNRVYYTGAVEDGVVIRTAKLGGGTPSTFYTPGGGVTSAGVTNIAVDAATGRVFWSELLYSFGDDGTSQIRSSLDGDSVDDVTDSSSTDAYFRLALGANGTLLYAWCGDSTCGLRKVARSGGTGSEVLPAVTDPYFGLESVPSTGKYYIANVADPGVSVGPWNGSSDPVATPVSLMVPAFYLTVGRIEPPATDPSLAKSGEPGGKSLGVRVGCGGAAKCKIKLSGKLLGGSGKLESKTVKVKAGKKSKVTLAYTQQLIGQLAAKGGGKIKVTAKQVGGGSATTTLRVPESVTG